MDMGVRPDARALLTALIAAAAPEPVPADQAIALLSRVDEPDAAVLGRLAYHALTGIDPGPLIDPPPPADVVPGFPSFASEVIQRAITGPDHRRPTARALVIVLETTGSASWPTAGRPHVGIREDVLVAADDRTDPRDTLRAQERAREHAEFRSMLTPAREVPLVDAPDEEALEVTEAGSEPEIVPSDLPADLPADLPDDEHEALRRVVATEHAVPRFEPLEGAGQVPGLGDDVVRRRRSSRRKSRHHTHHPRPAVAGVEPEPVVEPVVEPEAVVERKPEPTELAGPPADAAGTGRRETFILVAVLAVLIALAAIYAAAQKADEPADSGLPQGASRVSSQPLDVRV
jgi:hypothetical protein